MPTFAPAPLAHACARVLEGAGTPADIADRLGGWLINANLSGHPSHGVIRVPQYVMQIRDDDIRPAERPEIVEETGTTTLLDCRLGFGHVAADTLVRSLAEKAKRNRVAIGGIRNCTHIGRLGEWAELAMRLEVVLFMTAGGPGTHRVAPFGGAEGRLSTNPMAFGASAGDGDGLMMDFATTGAAEGKIRHYRDSGAQIPEGWIIDPDGNPTTDPNDYYRGGTALPFGGHKGYALSLMAEVLGGNLTGGQEQGLTTRIPAFALVIDPNAFGEGERFETSNRATLARMRDARPAAGFSEVLVPGDVERRSRAASRASGVELPDATWTAVQEAADSVGLGAAAVEALARDD